MKSKIYKNFGGGGKKLTRKNRKYLMKLYKKNRTRKHHGGGKIDDSDGRIRLYKTTKELNAAKERNDVQHYLVNLRKRNSYTGEEIIEQNWLTHDEYNTLHTEMLLKLNEEEADNRIRTGKTMMNTIVSDEVNKDWELYEAAWALVQGEKKPKETMFTGNFHKIRRRKVVFAGETQDNDGKLSPTKQSGGGWDEFYKTLAICTGGICKLNANHQRIQAYYKKFLLTVTTNYWRQRRRVPEYYHKPSNGWYFISKLENMLADYWERNKYNESRIPLFAPVYPYELNKYLEETEWSEDANGEPFIRQRPPYGFVLGHHYDNEGKPQHFPYGAYPSTRIHPYELYNFLKEYIKIQDAVLDGTNELGKFIIPPVLYYRQINSTSSSVPLDDGLLINMFWAFERDITTIGEIYFKDVHPFQLFKLGKMVPNGFEFDILEIFNCSNRRIKEIFYYAKLRDRDHDWDLLLKKQEQVNELKNGLWLKKRKNMYILFALFVYIRYAMYQASAGNISKEEILFAVNTFFDDNYNPHTFTFEAKFGDKILPPVDFRKSNLKPKNWKDPEALDKFKDLEIFKLKKDCKLHLLLKQYINGHPFYFSSKNFSPRETDKRKAHSLFIRRVALLDAQEYDHNQWNIHKTRKKRKSSERARKKLDPDGSNIIPSDIKRSAKRGPQTEEPDTCSICLEEIKKDDGVSPYECTHKLHRVPCETLVRQHGTIICPMCRAPEATMDGASTQGGGKKTRRKRYKRKRRTKRKMRKKRGGAGWSIKGKTLNNPNRIFNALVIGDRIETNWDGVLYYGTLIQKTEGKGRTYHKLKINWDKTGFEMFELNPANIEKYKFTVSSQFAEIPALRQQSYDDEKMAALEQQQVDTTGAPQYTQVPEGYESPPQISKRGRKPRHFLIPKTKNPKSKDIKEAAQEMIDNLKAQV